MTLIRCTTEPQVDPGDPAVEASGPSRPVRVQILEFIDSEILVETEHPQTKVRAVAVEQVELEALA